MTKRKQPEISAETNKKFTIVFDLDETLIFNSSEKFYVKDINFLFSSLFDLMQWAKEKNIELEFKFMTNRSTEGIPDDGEEGLPKLSAHIMDEILFANRWLKETKGDISKEDFFSAMRSFQTARHEKIFRLCTVNFDHDSFSLDIKTGKMTYKIILITPEGEERFDDYRTFLLRFSEIFPTVDVCVNHVMAFIVEYFSQVKITCSLSKQKTLIQEMKRQLRLFYKNHLLSGRQTYLVDDEKLEDYGYCRCIRREAEMCWKDIFEKIKNSLESDGVLCHAVQRRKLSETPSLFGGTERTAALDRLADVALRTVKIKGHAF